MLEDIKKRVFKANLELYKKGLVILTWGNVSEIDRAKGLVVIKPSGISYESMTFEDMVVVDLKTGKTVEGIYKPSSDTPTHLEIYKKFLNIGGIAHAHSLNAVAFAQAGTDIVALGTTHADYFYGDIPCTRELSKAEVDSNYEKSTGLVIIEEIVKRKYDAMAIPGILVKSHGPFAWGKDSLDAVLNMHVLEKVAEMNLKTLLINQNASIKPYILKKHYSRKHGPNAYYGQVNTKKRLAKKHKNR